MKKFCLKAAALLTVLILAGCVPTAAGAVTVTEGADTPETGPVCTTADEWTALFDRRGQENTWLGADGIFSAALDGSDAYGSAKRSTKTFFIFSDSLMGSADGEGNVYWAPGQPSQTSAVLSGNTADPDNIRFVWGNGGNGEFGSNTHLFGEHKWMLDCLVLNDTIYILGFPERDWKPAQVDMVSIPISRGEPDYANYSTTANIPELCYWDSTGTYMYAFGIGILCNTATAGAPDPDGYIYLYGYRDAMQEFSRKDLLAARIQESDFPDFSKLTYWDGEGWGTDIEEAAVLLSNVSCEMSVSPVTVGPCAGKYIAVYTEGTESANMMYAIGDSPVGPFDKPVKFYEAPEHGSVEGMYTYNAKAHPHLSSDGRLLVSYNCNNRSTFGHQNTTEYHPRFLWLDLNTVAPPEKNLTLSRNGGAIEASSQREGHEVQTAADGNTGTYWESDDGNGGAEQWLGVSWEEPQPVDRLVLIWGGGRPAVDTENLTAAGYGKVEYTADGATWEELDVSLTREGFLPCTDTLTLEDGPVTAKALRVHFTAFQLGSPYQCYEFEVYSPASGEEEKPLPGDLDGSGAADIQDVMAACKILARQNTGALPDADALARGDMNGDGAVSIEDVMAICKLLAAAAAA